MMFQNTFPLKSTQFKENIKNFYKNQRFGRFKLSEKCLYLKYRPKDFGEIVGNKATIDSLKSILTRKEGLPHAFLFIGPSGCGKTTIARILKDKLKCSEEFDFKELDAGQIGGIDTMRILKEDASLMSMTGGPKIFLIDECHALSSQAQNSLLKLLEDTPDHVYIFLCTTDPNKLIKTIYTRCATFQVNSLPRRDMHELIWKVLNAEKTSLPDKAVEEIIKVADGSARQALVVLDSVIDIQNDDDLINAICEYSINEKTIKDLCEALLGKYKWKDVSKIIAGIKEDPEKVRYSIMTYMEKVLLDNGNPQAAIILDELTSINFMYSKRPGLTTSCYRILLDTK